MPSDAPLRTLIHLLEDSLWLRLDIAFVGGHAAIVPAGLDVLLRATHRCWHGCGAAAATGQRGATPP